MLNYKQIWHRIKPTKLLIKFNLTVKNLERHFSFLPNREFRGYLTRWPFLRSTCQMTSWHDSLTSSHVLHMWLFHKLLYSLASHETTLIFIARLILYQSNLAWNQSQQRLVGNHNFTHKITPRCVIVENRST